MNNVVLIGRLARDPELRYMPSGMAFTRMTLAVDKELSAEKKQEAISQGKQTADFINISVFGKQAENCSTYLAKGSKCAINGRINTGSYTTQTGEKRYTTDVVANRVEFLDSKQEKQQMAGVNTDTSYFAGFEDTSNDDIFQPVGDDDEIPF